MVDGGVGGKSFGFADHSLQAFVQRGSLLTGGSTSAVLDEAHFHLSALGEVRGLIEDHDTISDRATIRHRWPFHAYPTVNELAPKQARR